MKHKTIIQQRIDRHKDFISDVKSNKRISEQTKKRIVFNSQLKINALTWILR